MSTRQLNNLINSATEPHSVGILSEGMLMDLKDIQLEQAQERVAEMEELVEKLSFALWNYRIACDGDKHMQEVIEDALGSVPSRFIEFYP